MKEQLEELLLDTVKSLQNQGELDQGIEIKVNVERTKDPQHGDFSTNLALMLAKPAKLNPRALAEKIIAIFGAVSLIEKVEIAGPGFINFFVNAKSQYQIIDQILQQGAAYGTSTLGSGKKVQVEFVSANPTGPLHVGHGRGAAYGSVVADLLEAVGYQVDREYYVNDSGRQMDILATSIWLRYLEKCGETIPFPSNGYQGQYVRDIADKLYQQDGNEYRHASVHVMDAIPLDEPQGGDKEQHIDALVKRAKDLMTKSQYRSVFDAGLQSILDDIRDDLAEFGVNYTHWFSERQLVDQGTVQRSLDQLQEKGFLYEQEGALWFASSRLGDEKDRVVKRDNGQITYFASDIAYHLNKLERGYDKIINVWGADHHGYVPRVKAAMQALGADSSRLEVLLVQFAVLFRGSEKVQMSTRSGEFVTLRELRNEVGKDAARFFYVMRRSDQHMEFDLELAKSKSNENPVFYVQYAHARICSVFKQLADKGWSDDSQSDNVDLSCLKETHETTLMTALARYPEVIERAATRYEPHQLIHYLRELANQFHTYYNACQFLVDDVELRQARLRLISAVKQILVNGLGLLNIDAPDSM